MENDEGKKRISFKLKNSTICPVCGYEFFREEMLTGSGRLIAGKLTDELRRLYEKNEKWGVICPLAYIVSVCPRCLYSAYTKDFMDVQPDELHKIQATAQVRRQSIEKFFGRLDFNDVRSLHHGAASYLLAVDCYSFRNKDVAPTFKMAVSALRAAWLFGDLARLEPEKPYKKISDFFYRKAYGFYFKVVDIIQSGEEPADAAGNMGPDIEKNWGYDGILYICAVLTLKVGAKEADMKKRIENCERTKRYLSKLFGSGKVSKNKPGPLLDMTRDLYDKMNEMLDQWKTGNHA